MFGVRPLHGLKPDSITHAPRADIGLIFCSAGSGLLIRIDLVMWIGADTGHG